MTRRGFYKVARLMGGRGFAFSSFVSSKEEKATKRRKNESRGIPIFPLDNPLLKTATQGPRPLCGEPQGSARTMAGVESGICHARKRLRLRRVLKMWAAVGGGPYGDYLSCFVSDCRGRLSWRPAVFLTHYVKRTRRGRPPGRPVPVNIRAVNQRWTGRLGDPYESIIINCCEIRCCHGPPGEAAPTTLYDGFFIIRLAGRPGVRPVRIFLRWGKAGKLLGNRCV